MLLRLVVSFRLLSQHEPLQDPKLGDLATTTISTSPLNCWLLLLASLRPHSRPGSLVASLSFRPELTCGRQSAVSRLSRRAALRSLTLLFLASRPTERLICHPCASQEIHEFILQPLEQRRVLPGRDTNTCRSPGEHTEA